MNLGEIVDIGGPPLPDPSDATPTSWFIYNIFNGEWNYQFSEGGNGVQNYRVFQKVGTSGDIQYSFRKAGESTIYFLGEGFIDLNTGEFSGSCVWAKIAAEEGALAFEGKFATQTSTLENYVAELDLRFNPGSLKYYTITGLKTN